MKTLENFESIDTKILECNVCNKKFVYSLRHHILRELTPNDRILIEEFAEVDNRFSALSTENIAVLRKIKNVPIPKTYSLVGGINSISFPCKIKLTNRRLIDCCRLILLRDIPFEYGLHESLKNIFFLREVEQVLESDYTIGYELRKKTNNGRYDEIYQPGYRDIETYYLKHKSGKKYRTSEYLRDFFKYKDVNGNSLTAFSKEETERIKNQKLVGINNELKGMQSENVVFGLMTPDILEFIEIENYNR